MEPEAAVVGSRNAETVVPYPPGGAAERLA
jgi:hypothetical protein